MNCIISVNIICFIKWKMILVNNLQKTHTYIYIKNNLLQIPYTKWAKTEKLSKDKFATRFWEYALEPTRYTIESNCRGLQCFFAILLAFSSCAQFKSRILIWFLFCHRHLLAYLLLMHPSAGISRKTIYLFILWWHSMLVSKQI